MHDAEEQRRLAARGLDITVPNVARIYDFILGGKDNISQVLSDVPHSTRTGIIQARQTHYSKIGLSPVRDMSGTYMGVMSDFLDGHS